MTPLQNNRYNFLHGILNKYHLNKVFTPNTTAQLTYIERQNIEMSLRNHLNIPGRQIILYGHSGSGKTTLIRTILKDLKIQPIITHCSTDTTFNDIILDAFDSLNPYYVSSKSLKSSSSVSEDLRIEYNEISSSIKVVKSITEEQKVERLLPARLTIKKLATLIGEIHSVWIIEDFHKVSDDQKRKIADVAKIFIDVANDYDDLKIICIGAVGSARELIQFDPNLYPRISEQQVPLLTDNEIQEIILRGCKLLNISMSKELMDKIIFYSNNLASVAHQMCYDVCVANKITKTMFKTKFIGDKAFEDAIKAYINSNSDTLKGIYESAVKNKLAWYILKSISASNKEKIHFEEIQRRVCACNRTFEEQDIINKLKELSDYPYNIIRFDDNSNAFSISTPFWGAFLKMQLALEAANKEKANKNRQNINLLLQNQKDMDSIVYKLLLLKLERLEIEYKNRQ